MGINFFFLCELFSASTLREIKLQIEAILINHFINNIYKKLL